MQPENRIYIRPNGRLYVGNEIDSCTEPEYEIDAMGTCDFDMYLLTWASWDSIEKNILFINSKSLIGWRTIPKSKRKNE